MVDKLVMYDLRMASTGDDGGQETHSTLDSTSTREEKNATRRKKQWSGKARYRRKTTTPLLALKYSNAYYSEQFGFDICETTNLVAAAEDTGGFNLYSLRTGAKIDGVPKTGERGPKPVEHPIKCLKFQKDSDCQPSLSVLDSRSLTLYS
jgi:hypothetical protein